MPNQRQTECLTEKLCPTVSPSGLKISDLETPVLETWLEQPVSASSVKQAAGQAIDGEFDVELGGAIAKQSGNASHTKNSERKEGQTAADKERCAGNQRNYSTLN
jgi:hypothetical protein